MYIYSWSMGKWNILNNSNSRLSVFTDSQIGIYLIIRL